MAIWDIKERNNLARANQHLNKGDRGVFAGGTPIPSTGDIIDFITISSAGNATDFGDLTAARGVMGATGDNTRGMWFGGAAPGFSDIIDYITIASTGNATDFGDSLQAKRQSVGAGYNL